MDKRKLVDIIVKDIEEIRILAEEVAESQDGSALVIDLALYRARLLCQEIELLRELAGNIPALEQQEEEVIFDREEQEDSVHDFPDPELEILNFDQDEYAETEELADEEDFEEEEDTEEELEDDLEEEEEDLTEDLEEDLNEEEALEEDLEETIEEDLEEEELSEEPEEEEDTQEEEDLQEEEKEQNHQPEPTIQHTELKVNAQPGVREIQIDDLDEEDDIEPIRFAPSTGPAVRPQMREIPKPDFLETESVENEKKVVGEKYQKERSLNDSIGEQKPMDSKLPFGRITSLRAAIGLNDRFLFIREIFDNNSEKYNQVIEQLDKMEQIQEAVEYLKANLTMQKNEASMKFVELLKRRFIP